MKIKHSKYKNTGLIFELLVKQIAADTLNKEESPAVGILKEYYASKSSLAKEFKLYDLVIKSTGVSQKRGEAIVSTITEVSRKLNQASLKKQKYNLISEIKKHYDLDEFFSIQVRDYKALAAMYCLLEAQNNSDIVDPQYLVDNKVTILEHLTATTQNEESVKDTLIEEYSKYDKDLRMLTFKILVICLLEAKELSSYNFRRLKLIVSHMDKLSDRFYASNVCLCNCIIFTSFSIVRSSELLKIIRKL